MRLTWVKASGLMLALSLSGAVSVDGQSIPSPFRFIETKQEAGLFGGQMTASGGRFGYAPDDALVIGARYGVQLGGPLSLEGVVNYLDATRSVIDPSRPEESWNIGSVPADLLTVDARFKFSLTGHRTWHRLSPFIFAGGGIAFDLTGSQALDETLLPEDVFDFGSSFFATLGGGTRWHLGNRWSLRGDGTFSLWKVDTPPGFSEPDRAFEGVEEGEWLWGTAWTVALLFHW
jgi:hypothetical protein